MTSRRTTKPTLHALFGMIARAVPEDALRPERAARLRERILERTAADLQAPQASTIRMQEGSWFTFAPGMDVKILHETAEAVSALVRMAPGAIHPFHAHEADEECLVLEGEIEFDGMRARAGDYHVACKGSSHTLRTETGVLMFVRTGAGVLHARASSLAAQ